MPRGVNRADSDVAEGIANFKPVHAGTGQEINLAMQELFLTGRILAVGARLFVRHTFTSGEEGPVEVVYSFMLPRDAALRRFRITGKGFSVESDLRPVEQAAKEYEQGIERGHLAALAREYRDGYVNLSVGNIRPGETVTVLLEIVAGVDLHDDGLRFRFPFTVAPCYHPRMRAAAVDEKTGELELPEDEFGDLLLPPFRKDAKNLHRIGFDLAVAMPQEIAETSSPSHAIGVRGSRDGRVHVRLAPDKDVPNRDLVLDVRMKAPFSGVLGGLDKAGRAHFAAVIASDQFGKAGVDPLRVVFLLDRSGSMEGDPIHQARSALLACLGALSAGDQVGCVAFDNIVEVFRDQLGEAGDETRQQLRAFIERINARGGTELFQGLEAACRLLGKEGGDIFLLTDGQVAGTDEIINRAKALGIRVHCLGIGSASQDRFLSQLARETGGISRFVTPRERVDNAALELFAAVGRPVATGVKASIEGAEQKAVSPKPPAFVYAGHPLLVYGEAKGSTARLKISYRHDGKVGSLLLPLGMKADPDAATVRLLRGARLIADLESQAAPGEEDAEGEQRTAASLKTRLEKLGRTYGLANRYMALVAVVERTGDEAGGPPKLSVVPVGMPEDVEFKAYFLAHRARQYQRMAPAMESASFSLRFMSSFDEVLDDQPAYALRAAPNLAVELCGLMEADGGMRAGRGDEQRICATVLALLVLVEAEDREGTGVYQRHIERLIAFLENTGLDALGVQERHLAHEVIQAVRRRAPITGPWKEMAYELVEDGLVCSGELWRVVKMALA